MNKASFRKRASSLIWSAAQEWLSESVVSSDNVVEPTSIVGVGVCRQPQALQVPPILFSQSHPEDTTLGAVSFGSIVHPSSLHPQRRFYSRPPHVQIEYLPSVMVQWAVLPGFRSPVSDVLVTGSSLNRHPRNDVSFYCSSNGFSPNEV
jgi:hypothetical protein